MRQFLLTSAAALIIGAFCFQTARATVLTFDDLPANENPVPSGYGGFDWYNQTTVGSFAPAAYGFQNTGYNYGTVSGSNVIFNWGGASPVEITLAAAGMFTYIGAFFTAAWEAETVSFTGLLHGNVVDTSGDYDITTTSPQFIDLDWAGIDELIISNTGQHWAMDNFTFTATSVTEPASLALLCAGLLGVGLLRRRVIGGVIVRRAEPAGHAF